jgi:hypothetical protein
MSTLLLQHPCCRAPGSTAVLPSTLQTNVTCCSAGCAQSELVKVDLKARKVVRRFHGIGTKSHGLVAWRGCLLVLDSEGGRLLRVKPHSGNHTTLYQVQLLTGSPTLSSRLHA